MKTIARFLIVMTVKRYFEILFKRGYKVRDVWIGSLIIGNWSIIFESRVCLIVIASDRREIFLSFAPLNSDDKDRVGIRTMIYFLSRREKFLGSFEGNLLRKRKEQFEILENLLIEYIDAITPYFGYEFEKYKHALFAAQKEYNNILLERYAAQH